MELNVARGAAPEFTPAETIDAVSILKQALAFHQAGYLSEAEQLYRRILQSQPRHFDSLHLLGVVHHHKGEHGEAVRQIDLALKVNPSFAAAHNNRGIALKELKRFDEALACYGKAISLDHNFADAYNNRGVVLYELGRFDEALTAFDRAAWLKPDYAEACNNRGNALKALKQFDEALKSYDRAIGLKRDFAVAYNNRGAVLKELGRMEEALASYNQAIALRPGDAGAYSNRGIIFAELQRLDEALADYDRAISLGLGDAEIFYSRANTLKDLGRFEDALASYDRTIALKPDDPRTFNNRGIVLAGLKRYEEAIESYNRAIALKSDYFEAFNNSGISNRLLKRFDEALGCYNRAIALKSDHAESFNNCGNVLKDLKQLDEALAFYEKALELRPDYAEAYNNGGMVLNDLRKFDEALVAYENAMVLKPNFAEASVNRGVALNNLGRFDEALASYRQAIALKSENADAFYNLGNTLRNLNRFEEAAAACEQALAWKPDQKYVEGVRLQAKMHVCDWSNLGEDCAHLAATIGGGHCASQPFVLLPTPVGPDIQRKCAEQFIADRLSTSLEPRWSGEVYSHERIRVAYVSGDLREHPVAVLMAGLFEQHDKARFETIAISLGGAVPDAMSARLKGAFERFIDVRGKGDREIAALLRDLEVDIAVDLNGFTGDARPGIFAERPAPVQVNYLGFAGTLGREYWDYVIADRFVIPEERQGDFAEKVVYLPGSFMANDDSRKISAQTPSRQEAGLPEQGFVFCCFNNAYKLTPDVFDIWMRLLGAVEGSVLWLSASHASAVRNLRAEAHKRGIAAERLVFASRVPSNEDHLARLRLADLFLDTLYYNAHTTACDALWAGLPIVTHPGRTFASRVAGSLLSAIGLPELIASSHKDYEALALGLARDPSRLAAIKDKLAKNRNTEALFDTKRFARHIEAAYTTMWQRTQNRQKPQNFAVD